MSWGVNYISVPLWRIGTLADELNRVNNTIHKWEADGVIAEPIHRSGHLRALRQYTKGEFDLIVAAKTWWWEEFNDGGVTMMPQLYRFGQIYWNSRKWLEDDRKYELIFSPPEDATLPRELDFDPDEITGDVFLYSTEEPCTVMDKIREVSRLVRDNPTLRKSGKLVEMRIKIMGSIFRSTTVDKLLERLERAENYATSTSS